MPLTATLLALGCERPPAATPPAAAFTIVVSGDTNGWITPCGCTSNQSGGLLRRGSFVAARRLEKPTLYVDVGGAVHGGSEYDLLKFDAILNGERKMGLAAHNIGAAEASLGAVALGASRATGAPLISANVQGEDGRPVAELSKVVTIGNRRVAITGVLSPKFVSGNLHVVEPRQALLAALSAIKGQFDSLLILAYLPPDELGALAASMPEADAVIGGPTGQPVAPYHAGPTLVTSATSKGKFLAVVDAGLAPPWQASIVEMNGTIAEDATQRRNLTEFLDTLRRLDLKPAQTGLAPPAPSGAPTDYRVAGSASCAACHPTSHATWQAAAHAHAWQTLAAKRFEVDPECMRCHTTGYGLPSGFASRARAPTGCRWGARVATGRRPHMSPTRRGTRLSRRPSSALRATTTRTARDSTTQPTGPASPTGPKPNPQGSPRMPVRSRLSLYLRRAAACAVVVALSILALRAQADDAAAAPSVEPPATRPSADTLPSIGATQTSVAVATQPAPVSTQPAPEAAPQASPVATQPSAIATQPSAIATQPSAIATQPSAIATQPSAIATQPSAIATTPTSAPATEPSANAATQASVNAATQPAAPAPLPWLDRFADALDEARRSHKPIFVDVGAEWCVWCRRLDAELSSPAVRQRLGNWVRLRLDADRDADTIHNLSIGPVPALRLLSPNGQMLAWRDGFMKAEELAAWLDAHSPAAPEAPPADLAASGAPDAAAVARLVDELIDRDPILHQAAARRLAPYPDQAAPAVVASFAAGNLRQRLAARELLLSWKAPVGKLDPWEPAAITPAAIDELKRWSAQKHQPPGPPSLTGADLEIARHDIAAMLQTTDPAEVESARERLARFGQALLPEVYTALGAATTDRERERLTALRYRAVATDALALRWPGGFDRLSAADAQTRHQAVEDLGARLTPDEAPLLMELFSDSDPFVRESSLRLLQSMGGETVSAGLVRLLRDPEPNVRAAVLKQLTESPDPRMVPEVARYVSTEKDVDLIVHAIRFLRELKGKAARDCLTSLLTHESWRSPGRSDRGAG